MISSYTANQEVTLFPAFTDSLGNPVTPVSATYALYDATGLVAEDQPVDLFSEDVPVLRVPASLNQIAQEGAHRGYRRVEISFGDDEGRSHQNSITYLIERLSALTPGVNSFATLPNLLMAAADLVNLRAFNNADERDQVAALITAWNNLGKLPVRFDDLEGTDRYIVGSTSELVDMDLNLLSERTQARLLRAQVIEADDVLGGNPIEMRRRIGLLSDSAGESAHFFRTTKPLSLPCCRRAVEELSGIVNWSISIGRR